MTDLKRLYQRASRYYDILDWPFEFFRYRLVRPKLWRNLHGTLLDLGAGTGRNVACYPDKSFVYTVDLSPAMLKKAQERIRENGRDAKCVEADASRLPLPDRSVDACVSTFLFCVLPDDRQPAVLREVRRVLKPEGRLRLLEYVYSKNPWRRFWMRMLSPLVEFLYGARFDRQTKNHLVASGFRIDREEFVAKDVLLFIEASPLY
ncbi:MAG: class I SAM-dependent methyltransferase [Elusimicrobia bacterium]|nr:class I SAM-dependent methyltransferase [Elusimicrobiota bacterium]